jgi:hypothetical protein
VSRLRATRVIKPDDATVTIAFGDFKPTVHVVHRHFPQGGSWSFFVCPSCGRRARTLRLHEGRVVCRMCDGLRAACMSGDRTRAIERLRALLYGGGKIQRRAQLERSLRRKIIVERRRRLGLPP